MKSRAKQLSSHQTELQEVRGVLEHGPSSIGGKAFNIGRLMDLGIHVPRTLLFPVGASSLNGLDEHLERITGSKSPWRLAIRSSSSVEDGSSESKAGHFLSLLGEFDIAAVHEGINQVRESGPQMAVILQPLIEAKIAGVAFSCDPFNFSRENSVLVWTDGLADRLVSGEVIGNRLSLSNLGPFDSGSWPLPKELLAELMSATRDIERGFGYPVDVEWAIDIRHTLWIVQARPVVLPQPIQVGLDCLSGFHLLPPLVQQHHKIRLRKDALEASVPMSDAIIECRAPARCKQIEGAGFSSLSKAAGVSVVLLHPEHVNQKVIREFASARGSDVEFFARGCRRYAVRRYPGAKTIDSAVDLVLAAGLETSWAAIAIAQEVRGAFATGIVKQLINEYVVEVALGHFVPKGVVPTSTAIISKEPKVVSVTWRDQPAVYHFVDGYVVTESPPERQLRLSNEVFENVIHTIKPLFNIYRNAAFEFGLLEVEGKVTVYLIDLAESDNEHIDFSAAMASLGVVSTGMCRGKVALVHLSDIGSLDRHLHDAIAHSEVREQIVIVAERASVELLPLVGAPGVVGFVFQSASILSHLAVVLREKGVPAVALDDRSTWESISHAAFVELDASSPNLLPIQRVTNIVTI